MKNPFNAVAAICFVLWNDKVCSQKVQNMEINMNEGHSVQIEITKT